MMVRTIPISRSGAVEYIINQANSSLFESFDRTTLCSKTKFPRVAYKVIMTPSGTVLRELFSYEDDDFPYIYNHRYNEYRLAENSSTICRSHSGTASPHWTKEMPAAGTFNIFR